MPTLCIARRAACLWTLLVAGAVGCGPIAAEANAHSDEARPADDDAQAADRVVAEGAALFTHVWAPGDPRSKGGDGLGPEYNASSCAGCHNQGGIGGAGGTHNDGLFGFQGIFLFGTRGLGTRGLGTRGLPPVPAEMEPRHRLGHDPTGSTHSMFGIARRNTPALFGLGLIDAIDDDAIENAALDPVRHDEVKGRVARTADGMIGRFGWKGDVATAATFVARACAFEVGLEVPGVPQPGASAAAPAPGLDLDLDDLTALTAFVTALPPPQAAKRSPFAERGAVIFDDVGCTDCHRESLGGIDGLYSDLLLHDLGPQLKDSIAAYGAPTGTDELAQLWRTPPLWGVRDSGPWLHDGSAHTLHDAIVAHAGEAARIQENYQALEPLDRTAVVAFLETLTAPQRSPLSLPPSP